MTDKRMKRFCRAFILLAFIHQYFWVDGQSLRESADSIRNIRGVPGLVYAVFSTDSILESEAMGYRVFKQKDHIQITDRFNIGTNTAAFTAYIAAKLVQAGKIKWSTHLTDVFPEIKSKILQVYTSITLQDLLNSRTRLPAFTDLNDWTHIPEFKGNIIDRRRSFMKWMIQQKPNMNNFHRENFVFSLGGYVVAASMLEKITNKSWEDLLTQYIRKPMGISIGYSWPNRTDSAAPWGHWSPGNNFTSESPNTWLKSNPVLYPAQDINISLPDYIKYMQKNLRGIMGYSESLPQKVFEFLFFGTPDYSMGWYNGSMNDQSYAFHEGISLLFDCRAEILKEKKIGIIVMCNSGDKDGRGAVLDLTRLLEEKYFN
jgi:CubicO group peptidase (beta-lactamase class C family)